MHVLLTIAHWFGAAVCDQLAADSFTFAGVVLPLCARCTGMYVGALLTLVYLAWRYPRTAVWPRPWLVVAFILFFLAWAGDGVNSFLSSIPSLPHLYPPSNLLRLTTGALMGITMGSFVFIMFNMYWVTPHEPARPLMARRDFLALLGVSALLVFVVQSEWAPLLYPLNLISLLAILSLHTLLMTALVGTLPWLAGRVRHSRVLSLATGFAIAMAYLNAFALVHTLLFQLMDRPL